MAEARSAVSRPVIDEMDEGKNDLSDILHAWRRSAFRRFYRTRNSIRNGMWPTSIYNLAVTTALSSVLLVGNWSVTQPITTRLWKLELFLHIHIGFPFYLRVFLLSACFGVLFFIILMYIRRFLLRILLSYRGWLYQRPHSQSWRTIFWAVLVRVLSGYAPSLFSCQSSLPKMAVPPLRNTLVQLLESLKPLYGPESRKIEELKKQSKEFERTIGNKLQRILVLRSWWSQNYVTDWWEKYIYLMGRSPLLINSNYYIMDCGEWKPTEHQCARAATVVHMMVTFKREIDREQLSPLLIRNTIPVCMMQYVRVFCTTRLPHIEMDEIKHYDSSRINHIVVMRKGHYYKLTVVDSRGNLLSPAALEQQFQWIVNDADKHEISETASQLPSLTGWDRVNWATTRDTHFASGTNHDFLETLESAIAFIVLDTVSPSTFTTRAQHGLLGSGKDCWADKSLTLKFTEHGHFVANVEHTWADAPVAGHLLEYIITNEILKLDQLYDSAGHALDPSHRRPPAPGNVTYPQRLVWEMTAPLAANITTAHLFTMKNIEDLDLQIYNHHSYGKGFVKTCKVSPDAFVQIAMQLAFYRLHGKFTLTYESCMTRLFLCGRTETVRSLTQPVVDFVLAMSANSVDRFLKIRLFRRACDTHQGLYRDSMAGFGIDRHLFALYVTCKGLGWDSEFLQSTLKLPWTLSTSQVPLQQIAGAPDVNLPQYRDKYTPGGGFGPVSDCGYGIAYLFAGDFRMFFHVSSKRSTVDTSSDRMCEAIGAALAEIRDIFQGPRDGDVEQ